MVWMSWVVTVYRAVRYTSTGCVTVYLIVMAETKSDVHFTPISLVRGNILARFPTQKCDFLPNGFVMETRTALMEVMKHTAHAQVTQVSSVLGAIPQYLTVTCVTMQRAVQ